MPKIFFGKTLLYAHAHYVCIVSAKYQKASVKALVQTDFLMYALSKHTHDPYLIGNRKKRLSSQGYHFVKNYYFGIKLLHTIVQCEILCKQGIRLFQQNAEVQVDSPHMHYLSALSMHKQNALRITKGKNSIRIGP